MRALLAALALLAAPAWAQDPAGPCRDVAFEGAAYTVCSAPPGADMRLFLDGPEGRLGGFGRVDAMLRAQGERLVFATNAGMYHPDRAPVGLYVEDGAQAMRLIESAGPGNFGMLPNGVLCLGARFAVLTTPAYAADPPDCAHATQSGPMLVIGGALHPRFIEGSDSLNVRNGAGVSPDGTLHLAISSRPVNFHDFARFFRDGLGTPDALYLDGRVSRLWAPGLGRRGAGLPLGPMIGLVAPAE